MERPPDIHIAVAPASTAPTMSQAQSSPMWIMRSGVTPKWWATAWKACGSGLEWPRRQEGKKSLTQAES